MSISLGDYLRQIKELKMKQAVEKNEIQQLLKRSREEKSKEIVSDFLNNYLVKNLHKKRNKEKIYYVFCRVEFGDCVDDNIDNYEDDNDPIDTITDEFVCYVNARSDLDASSKVEEIFINEYHIYDFKEVTTFNVRPLNLDQIIMLTQRTDLHPRYNSCEDDYVLCKKGQIVELPRDNITLGIHITSI